jgi:hypothetical protein
MLRCSDEEQMKILAEAIKYSDDMIRKVLVWGLLEESVIG